MQCKNCGHESAEGTIFCGNCGNRLDGKIACRKCGEMNDCESAYCVFCGNRIDGKHTCVHCGTAFDGYFCPSCGNQKDSGETSIKSKERIANTSAQGIKAQREHISQTSRIAISKFMNNIGEVCIFLGVLLSIVLVFFIGVSGEIETLYEDWNIFYFFGKYQDRIDLANISELELDYQLGTLLNRQIDIYQIFGIIISVVSILAVVLFGMITLVGTVYNLTHSDKKDIGVCGLACIISFLASVAIFYFYTRQTVTYSNEEVSMKLNIASLVGVILSSILGVFGAGCRLTVRIINDRKKKSFSIICALIAAISAMLVLIFGSQVAFDMIFKTEKITYQCNYLQINQTFDLLFAGFAENEKAFKNLETMNAWNTIAQIVMIILLFLTVFTILDNLEGHGTAALAYSVLILSIIALIATLVAYNAAEQLIKELGDGVIGVKTRCGFLIGCVVSSAVAALALFVKKWIDSEQCFKE